MVAGLSTTIELAAPCGHGVAVFRQRISSQFSATCYRRFQKILAKSGYVFVTENWLQIRNQFSGSNKESLHTVAATELFVVRMKPYEGILYYFPKIGYVFVTSFRLRIRNQFWQGFLGNPYTAALKNLAAVKRQQATGG